MRLAGLLSVILALSACASLPDNIGPFPEETTVTQPVLGAFEFRFSL